MSLKIGDHVMIVYNEGPYRVRWDEREKSYIGRCGTVVSEPMGSKELPALAIYRAVQFDDGEEWGVAEWALRKIGGEREDLKLVSWNACLWRPQRVVT